MNIFWKAIILVLTGTIFLRFAGRKSISQMTIAQTVVMISIGSLIVQPIAERNIQRTIITSAIFTGFIILMEYLQVKFDFIENLLAGKSKVVIKNGTIIPENMKRLRITVDQLEMRLRQQGISKISDVKTATLEANGQLGYELMRHAKPVTIGELEKMLSSYIIQQSPQEQENNTIFNEVINKNHNTEIPKKLQ